MDNIITADEVVSIAFNGLTKIKADCISEYAIKCATEKYILPILGKTMYNLLTTTYSDFNNEHIKPAAAFFVKAEAIPELSLVLGNFGVAVTNPQYMNSATDAQRAALYENTLSKGRTLMDAAVAYINENADEFPDYRKSGYRAQCTGGLLL